MVSDSSCGLPIFFARVKIEGTTRFAYTDNDGTYRIDDVLNGEHVVSAEHL